MSKIILDETSAPVSGEAGKHKLVARADGFREVGPDGTETLISGTAAVTAHVAQGGAAHGAATPSAAGFMSATDKTKLTGIAAGATANDTDENLKNRANHTGEQPISSVTGLPGALNSKADLVDGKVAASQLPSYVDDVLEYADFASLPATGEAGKIYVLATPYTSGGVTSSQYRWSGTAYAPIIASPGSSDAVTEGATNLYHTASRVLNTVLTGLSTATGTVVNATHTVLQAIGFLQKQVTDLGTSKANLSGADFTGPVSVISNIGVGSTNRTDLNGTGKGVITANAPGSGGGYHAQYDGGNVGYVIAAADALRINTFTGKTIKLGVEAIDRVEITSTGIQGPIGQDTPAAGSFTSVTTSGNVGVGATANSSNNPGEVKVIAVGGTGGSGIFGTNGGGPAEYVAIATNAYHNGGWRYHKDGYASTRYEQLNGTHTWSTAGASTAGAPITWAQVASITPTGFQGAIGQTTPAAGSFTGLTNVGNGFQQILCRSLDGGTTSLQLLGSGVSAWQIDNVSGTLKFIKDAIEEAQIDASGYLTVNGGFSNQSITSILAPNGGAYNALSQTNDALLFGNGQYKPLTLACHDGAALRLSQSTIDFGMPSSGTPVMSLNNGNLALGVALSNWTMLGPVFQMESIAIAHDVNSFYQVNNAVYDSGSWKFIGNTGTKYATMYSQDSALGSHKWSVSNQGAASDAVGFTEAMTLNSNGNLGLGVTGSARRLALGGKIYPDIVLKSTAASGGVGGGTIYFGDNASDTVGWINYELGDNSLDIRVNNTPALKIDSSCNLLVGVTSGSFHRIHKEAAQGSDIIQFSGVNGPIAAFYGAAGFGWNGAAVAMLIAANTVTGRSINTGGTINASGADYAEYYRKADGCGVIAKGAIVGVDADGKLTDKWVDSVSFLIKSTNPSYVGGDVWGSEDALGLSRPTEPKFTPPEYSGAAHPGEAPVAPQAPAEGADEEALAVYAAALEAYEAAAAAYDSALSTYNLDQQAHAAAVEVAQQIFDTATYPNYLQEKATFEAALEAARQKVDRIAFSGQVPVNVLGAVPGQYVVPVQNGEGIVGMLVDDADITFEQYRRAVGVVQNILPDGRANVRVKAC